MSIGQNIRRLRHDRGWSQNDLSTRTGIKVGHISTLEKDRGNPTLDTLQRLVRAFECSWDTLLGDLEHMSRNAILRQTLERALQLPDPNKDAIIEVIDGYCRACGIEQAFAPGNSRFRWARLYTEAPERVPLRKTDHVPDRAEAEEESQ